MASRDLLPGIHPDACPPRVVIASQQAIARARLRATLRDAAQLLLLFAVDYFFTQWPSAHIPLVGRPNTLIIVMLLNALVLAHVALSRLVPKWSARRIAATWCLTERTRFFADERRDQTRH